MDQKTRNKLGYREGFASIVVNIILFALKYWAGIVSGSIALIADAWHTLSDSISSLIVIAGVKLSSKKPDKEHPFGHGRWEHIASIFIGFMLAVIAYNFMREAIQRLSSHESANFGLVAITVTIISIVMKEGLARYAFYIWKKTNNTSVKADGWHHRTDALSSVVILVGILAKDYIWWVDSILGIIISLMLFYTVYEITRDSISKLLGEKPSDELIARIKNIVNSHPYPDLNPHHFHLHYYGNHKELTFHIKLDENMNINKGHQIATEIENEIREKLNIESTIHIEPKYVEH